MAEAEKYPEYIWMDGKIIPFREATIHVMSACARYGTNVFEGICGYWNPDKEELYCFRLREHYVRLLNSMRIMDLDLPHTIDDHIGFLLEVLRKNRFRQDVHIRHQVLVTGIGNFSLAEPVSMFIAAIPRTALPPVKEGVRCCVSSWTRISDSSVPPRVKAGSNYQNSRLAQRWARKAGFDEAILLNERGKVAEAPGACIGIIREGVFVTPAVTEGILESVTRQTVLTLVQDVLKMKVSERPVDRTELYVAEEALLFGSGAQIKPVLEIDGLKLRSAAPDSLTRKIGNCYFEVVRGKNSDYMHWLTPVYRGYERQ